MTLRAAATGTAIAALALASAADASLVRFGSDLNAPANKRETHPVDSAFWAKALANGTRVSVPAKGKIKTVKLKGTAIKQGGRRPRRGSTSRSCIRSRTARSA